eukprot:m.613446 g.613446  ORF g.613446 m.613446 type:complete len:69 (+) comp58147_c0_seq70:2997-3203(+)
MRLVKLNSCRISPMSSSDRLKTFMELWKETRRAFHGEENAVLFVKHLRLKLPMATKQLTGRKIGVEIS